MIKLMKILDEIKIPIKVGDTILVGKWRNKPVVVKTIGTDENGLPTVNGRSIVNFRLQKKEKKSKNKLKESPHFYDGKRTFDLHIEKYPMSNAQKNALLKAYYSDAGISGYSKKYDRIVTFKRTGVHMIPKSGVSLQSPVVDAPPLAIDTDMPKNKNLRLPEYWERYIEGTY